MSVGDIYGIGTGQTEYGRTGAFLIAVEYIGTLLCLCDWGEVMVYGVYGVKNMFTFSINNSGARTIQANVAIDHVVRIKILG